MNKNSKCTLSQSTSLSPSADHRRHISDGTCSAEVLSDALALPGAGPVGGELRRSCLLRSGASHRSRVAAPPTVFSAPADRQPPSPPPSRHRQSPAASPPPRRRRQPSKLAVSTRATATITEVHYYFNATSFVHAPNYHPVAPPQRHTSRNSIATATLCCMPCRLSCARR